MDRKGRYHKQTPLFQEAVELHVVTRSTGRTLYTRTGNAILLFPLAVLVWALVRSRRSRS